MQVITSRITNLETALAYYAAVGLEAPAHTDGSVTIAAHCTRCGGSGIYSHYHGTCYDCEGAVTKGATRQISLVGMAQTAKAKHNKAAREYQERLKAAEAFDLEHPGVRAFLETNQRNAFLTSLRSQLGRFGTLSGAQLAAVAKAQERASQAAQEASQAGPLPQGTWTGEVTVISTRTQDGQWGSNLKALLRLPNGSKAWGTCPKVLAQLPHAQRPGQTIEFTATLEPSKDDPSFGFFKRPRKVQVTTPVVPADLPEGLEWTSTFGGGYYADTPDAEYRATPWNGGYTVERWDSQPTSDWEYVGHLTEVLSDLDQITTLVVTYKGQEYHDRVDALRGTWGHDRVERALGDYEARGDHEQEDADNDRQGYYDRQGN